MTISANRITRSVAPKAIFEDLGLGRGLSSAVSWNQGDLLYFDSSLKLVKKMAAETDAATFLGIARVAIASGVEIGPYSGLASSSHTAIGATPGPQYGVIAALVLKNGDALTFGASVYADPVTGPYQIQASGTKPIGTYQGVAITGDGTIAVEVLLGARYPNDTLKF